MSLTPGTGLGPAEILSAIGTGGMGEVNAFVHGARIRALALFHKHLFSARAEFTGPAQASQSDTRGSSDRFSARASEGF
jgi:hypothetical protein